jgi:succinyl-CoA synthetase beta subunit
MPLAHHVDRQKHAQVCSCRCSWLLGSFRFRFPFPQSLFHQYGIPTPRSRTVSTPAEAETAAESLGGSDFVVKAQVLAGGRGKGKFTSGFTGGVHTCISALEARSLAAKMLNQNLITKQTGPEGKLCHKVMVCERLYLRREAYFAILMDRESSGPVMVASPAGGMDIEKVAAETPKLIFKEAIDITRGIQPGQTERLAKAMGFGSEQAAKEADKIIRQLYKLFLEKDATLVEVNPISETHDGRSQFDAQSSILRLGINLGCSSFVVFSLLSPLACFHFLSSVCGCEVELR